MTTTAPQPTVETLTHHNQLANGDPLFDGVGVCAGTCCDNLNQPWFKKTVPQQTTENLEMRLCVDQPFSDEAVAFDLMELYIRVD